MPHVFVMEYKNWPISSSTGIELPNVFLQNPNSNGFEIRNARLPEHDGQVECVAQTKGGLISFFSLLSKKVPNHYSELFFRWIR